MFLCKSSLVLWRPIFACWSFTSVSQSWGIPGPLHTEAQAIQLPWEEMEQCDSLRKVTIASAAGFDNVTYLYLTGNQILASALKRNIMTHPGGWGLYLQTSSTTIKTRHGASLSHHSQRTKRSMRYRRTVYKQSCSPVSSISTMTRKAAQPCCVRPVLYHLIICFETLFDKWEKNVFRLVHSFSLIF